MNKVTKESLNGKIKKITYMRVPDSTVTICQLELLNGFSVRGESACVDPQNFDSELGEEHAFQDAFSKLWQLEGYLLKESLWQQEFYDSLPKAPRMHLPLNQSFGWALEMLEIGKRVAREGWNGKGMWLSLSVSQENTLAAARSIPADSFWSDNNRDYAKEQGGYATVLPCITMKTASGEILMGWLASQSDMLAKDWVVVEG